MATTLRMLFFPFLAPGHMLPMLDMAKLFAARGVNCSVVTTPANAAVVRPSLDQHPIEIVVVPFPSAASTGLPDGCENLYSVPSPKLEPNFYEAVGMLREPFARVLRELQPVHCIVTDMFLPWAYHVAAELDVPTLLFYGIGFFALCCYHSIACYNPLAGLSADDSFVVPRLPHAITMFRSQIGNVATERPEIKKIVLMAREVEERCFGTVMNTFYELEPDCSKHYREAVGRRAWHLGPVSLCDTTGTVHRSGRGGKDVSSWLDGKGGRVGSVVYVCFGSRCHFSASQLREIALGLEATNRPFVWVVRREEEGWMPEGYEERVVARGLIIRGWAKQRLILNHEAVGGFLTHCGWNSVLEGVSSGLPLATWPLYADQFFNERLIVDVLKMGVEIGVRSMVAKHEERELVAATKIERIVGELMDGGNDGEARRIRARELGVMARKAVEKGGSSYVDTDNLIRELTERPARDKLIIK